MTMTHLLYFLLLFLFKFLKICYELSGDKLVGEASRIVVAEACVQALDLEVTENQVYEINSVEVMFKWYFWHRLYKMIHLFLFLIRKNAIALIMYFDITLTIICNIL